VKKLTSLFLIIIFIFLTSCSGRKGPAHPEPGELRPLRVANQWHVQGLPVYIAEQEGMFIDAGLDVTTLTFGTGPPMNEALGAGLWDVGIYGPVPAISSGIANSTRLIAGSAEDTMSVEFFVRPNSDIAGISGRSGVPGILGDANSWRGKTILCHVGTNNHFFLLANLGRIGLTQDDVRIIPMDVSSAFAAFRAGQGDIVSLWAPYNIFARDEGYVLAASGTTTGERIFMVIVASEEAFRTKKDELTDFLRVYFQAAEKYKDNMPMYVKYMLQFQMEHGLQVDERLVSISAHERPLPTLDDQRMLWAGNPGQRMIDTSLFRIMDFFIDQGQFTQADKQRLQASGFVDNEIINRILNN
jgi:ABC-type nitrate/sulfonate/bicarbonate transport system substrate-binding protein